MRRLLPITLTAALLLAACGDGDDTGTARLQVAAAFYPLAYLADQVGGDRISVSQVAPPGAEPHDLELTPGDLATLSDADLVISLPGFIPAIDDAVAGLDPDALFDSSQAADLTLTYTPIEEGAANTDEAGTVDPHFWLDPQRMAAVATALADRLTALDPDGADAYRAGLASLTERLSALDETWRAGTADCAESTLVTSHNAFGYLAERYGFEQYGITGLTPEEEPSPQALAAATDYVSANQVSTIYYETLVSPAVAETVAAETGAATAVLDPIEGVTDPSSDYLSLMTANLESVRVGQSCS
jgi:zinc transport system substrate-binding protein